MWNNYFLEASSHLNYYKLVMHEYIPQVVQNVKSSHNNNIPRITILTIGIGAFQNFEFFYPTYPKCAMWHDIGGQQQINVCTS